MKRTTDYYFKSTVADSSQKEKGKASSSSSVQLTKLEQVENDSIYWLYSNHLTYILWNHLTKKNLI